MHALQNVLPESKMFMCSVFYSNVLISTNYKNNNCVEKDRQVNLNEQGFFFSIEEA